MWSPQFKKIVFIDFGMTKTIKQSIGNMSKTKFFGTYHYASLDMKKIFINKKSEYIDLYYNDVHSFQISLEFYYFS